MSVPFRCSEFTDSQRGILGLLNRTINQVYESLSVSTRYEGINNYNRWKLKQTFYECLDIYEEEFGENGYLTEIKKTKNYDWNFISNIDEISVNLSKLSKSI